MSSAFAKTYMELAGAVVCAGHMNPQAGLL